MRAAEVRTVFAPLRERASGPRRLRRGETCARADGSVPGRGPAPCRPRDPRATRLRRPFLAARRVSASVLVDDRLRRQPDHDALRRAGAGKRAQLGPRVRPRPLRSADRARAGANAAGARLLDDVAREPEPVLGGLRLRSAAVLARRMGAARRAARRSARRHRPRASSWPRSRPCDRRRSVSSPTPSAIRCTSSCASTSSWR